MADWPDDVNEEDGVGKSRGTDGGGGGLPSPLGIRTVGTDLGVTGSTTAGTLSPTEIDA